MLEQTKRISFGISSVLYKVEPEPDLYTGSGQKVPAPTGFGSATLVVVTNTGYNGMPTSLGIVRTLIHCHG